MFFRKKQKPTIPKDVFQLPLKHRYTFVPEGSTYYEGVTITISKKVSTEKKAFALASAYFQQHSEKSKHGVAVFYGDVESPDCNDVLYGAYNSFEKRKKR